MEPRRATPLIVAENVEERLQPFLALGFERVDTGAAGIVSLRAGNSFVLVAGLAALDRFQPATVARLRQGRTLLLYVPTVAEAIRALPASADIVEVAPRPPFEAVVQMGDDLLLVSERVPGPRWQEEAVTGMVH